MFKQDQKVVRKMKISLKEYRTNNKGDYGLDAIEKYTINLEEEMEYQKTIYDFMRVMGKPPAIKNYYSWLYMNHFNVEYPNPTNEFVATYYGEKPLWKTDYSQGIVVKGEDEEDYYIVMECSDKNKGYKNTRIILTLGGCL